MYIKSQTRADARGLVGAVLVGSITGLALGGVYLAGGLAQTANQHARVTRLADGASEGFSDAALVNAASRMDPGALAVARRHDPYTVAGAAQRDRQVALLVARLENNPAGGSVPNPRTSPLMLRASFGGPFNPAASPFRLGNALESSREQECLAVAVYYEARGETPSGQAAVAQVVLNRVRHPAFPKSICGVVFQGSYRRVGCQFSFACDGSMNRSRERGAWSRAQKIASRALTGTVMTEVGSATHFHTTGVSPGWGPRLLRVAQVGMHVFYRFGGRAGSSGAFSSTPRPSTLDDMPNAPVIAGLSPGLADGLTADGKPMTGSVVYAANAVRDLQPASANGMGGPLGQATEPASAPEPAKPTVDKTAAETVRTPSAAAIGAAS